MAQPAWLRVVGQSLDVLRAYVRDAERFENHAGTGLLQSSLGKVT
jgi:hypothetical protein